MRRLRRGPRRRRKPPLALSVDVEDYFQVQAFAAIVSRDAWPSFPSRVVGNTRRLLDLFDESGARGTFFVLGWVAAREPDLVREIAARGHRSRLPRDGPSPLTEALPDEFFAQARDSRALLEISPRLPSSAFARQLQRGEGDLVGDRGPRPRGLCLR